ncbi:hypothetical protein VTN31DRAFT_2679 [Thermomyces dupontii]|uniref:uncharacterized protein n=1 Tax=Talaromyces thermophilus TaxID=28565 RepID=UPI00374381C5
MQIDPAALYRNDATNGTNNNNPASSSAPASGSTASKTVGGSNTGGGSSSSSKSGRGGLISVPRLDLEPVYTELKAAIGEHWAEYKQAVALFLLGHLNQEEFSARVDYFLCADPRTEHLHNNFVCAIIGNLSRDLPDHGVASWVSANDKPTVVSKPVSSDLAEQRLKTEVMQLPPRDRRRIKAIPEPDPNDVPRSELEEYHQAKQIRLPSQVPASAGGLNKTNWELEIRKRYAQPLASETGEFPDAETIHARMVPICYEESVVSGAGFPCAEFMAIATETFVKEVLSAVFARTRHNGPSGTINGMMTRRYRRQLEREELAYTRGEITKDAATGLLPVEAREARTRRPLGIKDLRLALDLGGGLLGQNPLLADEIAAAYDEDELELERRGLEEQFEGRRKIEKEYQQYIDFEREAEIMATQNQDLLEDGGGDAMDLDEENWEWEGATLADREQLGALLDDCLSMAA